MNFYWYKERCLYRIATRRYNEFLSTEGELLYNRQYDLVLVTYEGKKPTSSVAAGSLGYRREVPEEELTTEDDYQKELIDAAAAAQKV
jgi:hypothetical protein